MFQVTDEASFRQALEFISVNEILAYDTETDGLNPRQNRVIGFGVSNEADGFYIQLFAWSEGALSLTAQSVFGLAILNALQGKKLLTWNASFDMRFTKHNLGIDLLPSLHADVLLMKHTCDEEFPFGLKEVAASVFGQDAKKEKEEMQASVKQNGGTAKQYYKADPNILAKYCVQDCILTFRLYRHFSDSLSNQRLEDFYYCSEVLPLYKEITIPMEERGVQLDMPLLRQTLEDISQELIKLESNIQSQIAPALPAVFEPWFLNKEYPLKTATGKEPAWRKKHATQKDAWAADNPGSYMFNLLSKHHLKKLFFNTLDCTPVGRTPTGQPQVDEEFLDSVKDKLAWVNDLITYNQLTKIKGTYIERFLQECEHGIFYPSFFQHRTVSGRYGSDLQQLPRIQPDGGIAETYSNRIRAFITARPAHSLISADYQSLEPRIFAHTSGDSGLQKIFKDNKDFYSTIAQQTEGLEAVSKEQRQKAKAYALGIPYGMTGYKLKFQIGCDQETADRLVQRYLNAFPELASWMEASKDRAMQQGYVISEAGRRRRLQRAPALYKKWGAGMLDDLVLWKRYNQTSLYEEAKAARREFKNLLNNAINFQIQSLAASVVNRAAIAIMRQFRALGMKSHIVMQIHDELVFEVPDLEVQEAVNIIRRGMEQTTRLSVDLPASPVVGRNFAECK